MRRAVSLSAGLHSLLLAGVVLNASAACADVLRLGEGETVTVDGRLDEPAWARGCREGNFSRWKSGGDAPIASQTEFTVLADDRTVYVGVICHESDMEALKRRQEKSIWGGESVEVFLNPGRSPMEFYQFAVCARNNRSYTMYYAENGNITPDPYAPDWKFAVSHAADRWFVEMAIPLRAFYMTRQGNWTDRWRVNVGRDSWTHRTPKSFGELTSWSPLDRGFLEPWNFREMDGFPMRAADEDLAIESCVARIDSDAGGRLSGTLRTEVFAGECGGEFEFSSGDGGTRRVTLVRGANRIETRTSFPGCGRQSRRLELRRLSDGLVFARDYPVRVDFRPIAVRLGKPAYRDNFYPGQDSSSVTGTVRSAVGAETRLTLEGPGIPRTSVLAAPDGSFAFATPGFAEGTAVLTAESGGRVERLRIRKLPPSGHRMTWIENGRIVVDGKPVFRRNIYGENRDRAGFRFERQYDNDADMDRTLGTMRAVLIEVNRLVKGYEQKEGTKDVRPSQIVFDRLDEVIESRRNDEFSHYFLSDEPECRDVSPVYLRHLYEYVKEKDPYHLVLICSRGNSDYLTCSDWIEAHPYLNPQVDETGRRTYGRRLDEVGRYVDAFGADGRPDKCVGLVAQAFAYRWMAPNAAYPTLREYVAMNWAAILRGARSLWPYSYHDVGDRASILEGTRYVFSSVAALEDFLLFARRDTLVRTSEYEATLWTLPSGERLLAAVNFTEERQTASLGGLKGEFFEFRGERVFASGWFGGFSLDLEPQETIVATDGRRRGTRLLTYAQTQTKVDLLEAERRSRDNQLLERERDVTVHADGKYGGSMSYKMFDGIRDFYAWGRGVPAPKAFEIEFTKVRPSFSELRLYGAELADVSVSLKTDGKWTTVKAVPTRREEYLLFFDFGQTFRPEALRLVFPAKQAELYEIEIPAVRKDVRK